MSVNSVKRKVKSIYVDEEFCKGCGICIEFCPTKVFERSSKLSMRGVFPPVPAHIEKCTACGICDLYCPDFAIILEMDGGR